MSTAVMNHPAVRQLRDAQAQVEKIKNDEQQFFPEAASIGDAVRQGDIYIQLIDPVTKPPMLYKLASPTFPMQLAEGNTKGSRHCLLHGNGVTVYEPVGRDDVEMLAQLAAQYGIKTTDADWRTKMTNAEWDARRTNDNSKLRVGDASALLEFAGPIFTLTETNTVTHPEHGDWVLPPGSYRITYQRTMTREATVTRVLD